MSIILSDFAKGVQTTVNADCAGDLVVNAFYADLKAADLVAGNTIDLGILPAGHSIYGARFVPDDLDTGTAITIDIGLMSGTPGQNDASRTVGTELFAAANAAQSGAAAEAALSKSSLTIMAQPYDRSIGAKIVAAPTGAVAGRLRLLVTMYATNSGVQF